MVFKITVLISISWFPKFLSLTVFFLSLATTIAGVTLVILGSMSYIEIILLDAIVSDIGFIFRQFNWEFLTLPCYIFLITYKMFGEMESKLIELAISNGAFVLIVGTALFLVKSLVKYYLGLDTENYKSELNKDLEQAKTKLAQENLTFSHKLSQDMEAYKHQFELLKQKNQTEFTHLHAERAKVIKGLYLKLIELHAATHIFTRTIHRVIEDGEKEEKERLEKVSLAYHEFKNFYLPNKLYFSKSIVAQLDRILSEAWEKSDDFARKQNFFKMGMVSREAYRQHKDEMNKISDIVAKDFPPMIEKIEDEFRNILGVRD